jgi:hypothetical protein
MDGHTTRFWHGRRFLFLLDFLLAILFVGVGTVVFIFIPRVGVIVVTLSTII